MLTKEEQGLLQYQINHEPTDPSLIDHNTPLNELNLNWREKDLPQRHRTKHVHGMHPYLGKYVPQLVEIFLRKYFNKNETILDPFCGSGTSLIQANELGINSIGYDISAFNVLLCKVKSERYDIDLLKKEVSDILTKTYKYCKSNSQQLSFFIEPELKQNQLKSESNYLFDWYSDKSISELLTYKNLIDEGNYRYRDFLKIILTRAARSARLTKHFNLDFPKKPQREPYYCYKHSRICHPTDEAYKFLKRYSIDSVRRVESFSTLRTPATIHVHHDDSREANVGYVDGIITSPPYVGLIDYHEQHNYAYNLLNLHDKREYEIGAAVKGTNVKAKDKYIRDITDVLRNVILNMKLDGYVIIVAADKHQIYETIIENSNLKQIDSIHRHVNRRTGQRANAFYETVFICQKK